MSGFGVARRLLKQQQIKDNLLTFNRITYRNETEKQTPTSIEKR